VGAHDRLTDPQLGDKSLNKTCVTTILLSATILLALLPAANPSVAHAAGRCHPAKKAWPSWVPSDLPFPAGTYLFDQQTESSGYQRGRFYLPVGTSAFARFVLDQWPDHGWSLGRGDSEPGQVEDNFTKSGVGAGAFRADDLRCKTVVYLIFKPTS
jgi:hypothetical protein